MKNSTKAVVAAGALGVGAVLVYLATRPQLQGLASAHAKEEEMLERAFPLGVGTLSDTKTFTIGVAEAFGICVQAIVRDVGQNTMSYWSFISDSWSGTGRVRPGAGNLGLSFQARNISGAGNLTLTIKDDTGATLTTQTIAAGSVGSTTQYVTTTEVIVAMPDRAYAITVSVTP